MTAPVSCRTSLWMKLEFWKEMKSADWVHVAHAHGLSVQLMYLFSFMLDIAGHPLLSNHVRTCRGDKIIYLWVWHPSNPAADPGPGTNIITRNHRVDEQVPVKSKLVSGLQELLEYNWRPGHDVTHTELRPDVEAACSVSSSQQLNANNREWMTGGCSVWIVWAEVLIVFWLFRS